MTKQIGKETTAAVDEEKLSRFIGQFVTDFGAAMHAPTIILGEKLGLYRAMSGGGELTSQELASKTGTNERYVREWLSAQAASGYVMYNHLSGKFWLSPEQAFTLADENSPAYLPGAFYIASAIAKDEPKLVEAFRTGKGVGWHEHDGNLFRGTEKFFRPGYSANLVSSWLPALDGVVAKLEKGSKGRGHRMRPRGVDHNHGEGVSEVEIHRIRLPRAFHRGGQSGREEGRGGRPRDIRGGLGEDVPRQGL